MNRISEQEGAGMEVREIKSRRLDMNRGAFDGYPEGTWLPETHSDTKLIVGIPDDEIPRWIEWASQGGYEVIRIWNGAGKLIFSLRNDMRLV